MKKISKFLLIVILCIVIASIIIYFPGQIILKSIISKEIENSFYCVKDSDCVDLESSKYPFACNIAVNKSKKDFIKILLTFYKSPGVNDCFGISQISCKENRCRANLTLKEYEDITKSIEINGKIYKLNDTIKIGTSSLTEKNCISPPVVVIKKIDFTSFVLENKNLTTNSYQRKEILEGVCIAPKSKCMDVYYEYCFTQIKSGDIPAWEYALRSESTMPKPNN